MPLRQQLLVMYLATPDPGSNVGAWSVFDGTGREPHTTGDADEPPYRSVLEAMRDGWRVIQFPVRIPAFPGQEYTTSFLKYEFVLEKMVEV